MLEKTSYQLCWRRATAGVFFSLTSEWGVPNASPKSFTSCQNLGKGLVHLASFSCVLPVRFLRGLLLSTFHLHRLFFRCFSFIRFVFLVQVRLSFLQMTHLQNDSSHIHRGAHTVKLVRETFPLLLQLLTTQRSQRGTGPVIELGKVVKTLCYIKQCCILPMHTGPGEIWFKRLIQSQFTFRQENTEFF